MIDELDKKIIELLERDAWQSSKTMSNVLHLSPSTIRHRIDRLIRDKVIHFTALTSPYKTGEPVLAHVLFNVDSRELNSCMDILSKITQCKYVEASIGKYNVLATFACRNTTEANNLPAKIIPKLNGVKGYELIICTKIVKSFNPLHLTAPSP